ncbi:hypothetical protein BDR22DRAFT_123137 [Usnea florida]
MYSMKMKRGSLRARILRTPRFTFWPSLLVQLVILHSLDPVVFHEDVALNGTHPPTPKLFPHRRSDIRSVSPASPINNG